MSSSPGLGMACLIQRSVFPLEEASRGQRRRCMETKPQELHRIEEKDAEHARTLPRLTDDEWEACHCCEAPACQGFGIKAYGPLSGHHCPVLLGPKRCCGTPSVGPLIRWKDGRSGFFTHDRPASRRPALAC